MTTTDRTELPGPDVVQTDSNAVLLGGNIASHALCTPERFALLARLGPAAEQLTIEQIDRLAREADIIAERYPGPDHRDEHDAALSAAVQWLLGEITVEQAGAKRQRALLRERATKAAAIQVAAMAIEDGGSERQVAAGAGIDRQTLRKRLGKQ